MIQGRDEAVDALHEEIEVGLRLLGATAIEDKLQVITVVVSSYTMSRRCGLACLYILVGVTCGHERRCTFDLVFTLDTGVVLTWTVQWGLVPSFYTSFFRFLFET